MTLATKLHHCYSNAAAAQAEADHYQSRAEHWRAVDQRRRDAASMFWKARAARRVAAGHLKQAAELQAEEDKQPDMFAAPAESAEIEEALEAFDQVEADVDCCCQCGEIKARDEGHTEDSAGDGRTTFVCIECLTKSDTRKTESGLYKGHEWLAIPAFCRFGKPGYQLKCRQGYDKTKEWEGGYSWKDTLPEAIKHAKWRIDGVVEREPFKLEVQAAPVIVGKQLTAFEVQTDPNQMELF